MENPFEQIDNRLERIEKFLEQLMALPQQSVAPQPTNEDQVFNIDELAKYLKVTKSTIHRYKNNKVFPFYSAGRTVKFKKSEVDAAMYSVQPRTRR